MQGRIRIMQNKAELLKQILNCAKIYRENFSEHDFLLVYEDNGRIETLEISFTASNFRHLTGVNTKEEMTAYDFFNQVIEGRLSESDFEVRKNSMAENKLSVLPEFLRIPARSFNMIGEFNAYSKVNLETEHLAGGVNSCMGFTRNDNNIFVPNTMLQEDIRPNVIRVKPVVAVWRKKSGEGLYTDELRMNNDRLKKKKLIKSYDSLKDNKFQKR